MKPSQVVQSLRHIAAGIQASKNPDKNLVARDLKKIIAGISGSVYLLFTSDSGAALWTLPPGSNIVALKSAANAYNDTEAWKARGSDGTVYVFNDAELIEHFYEDDETIQSIEDIYGSIEQHGDIDEKRAMEMLSGQIDPFLNA